MPQKVYIQGTHRATSLEETRQRVEPFLRPMGITRVANITGLDNIGIPVVMVCRPNSRSLAVAQGKGHSLLAAEVSGIMESIEFYHAEAISSPLLLGSFNQLRFTHRLLNPALLPRSPLERYHDDLKIHWIEGVDLIQEQSCWVPLELVHTDFTHPLPSDSGCFPMTSNGLASGNHLLEAIVHGACEVMERDAEALFLLLSPLAREQRRLDLETVDDELCLGLIESFDAADVEVGVWDMTTDLGVPCFRAVIMDRTLNPDRPLRPNVGSGCHSSRGIALSRALTEAAQSRLTVISSSRDDLPREHFCEASDLERLRKLREKAMKGSPSRSYQQLEELSSSSFEDDVLSLKERLVSQGIEHLVTVNLTKPEFEIPVVRTIIPGLETMVEAPGWRPGARACRLMESQAK